MASYYIAFDTKDMYPYIKATRVTLDTELIRDMAKQLPVNLSEHPLYPQLVRYCQENPVRTKG